MGLELKTDIVSQLQSPERFALRSQGKDFPVEALSSDEANLLQSQLNSFIANLDSEMLTHLILQRQQALARTATFAKQQFDEKLFGGINAADNEIGMSILRPGQVLTTNGIVSDINNWYADPAGSGNQWVDWNATSGSPLSVNEDDVLLGLAFLDQESGPSEISGFNVQSFGRNVDMLPVDVNDARLQDNETDIQMVPIPSLVAQDGDSVHMRLRYDRDVERQPRLYGFSFSLGTRLNNEEF